MSERGRKEVENWPFISTSKEVNSGEEEENSILNDINVMEMGK